MHAPERARGPRVDAILATAAIPGVFPPVEVDGRDTIDGGVVNNTPLSHAVALGADTVWVLPTGYSCALSDPPQGALAIALQGLTLTVNQRLAVEVRHYGAAVTEAALMASQTRSETELERISTALDGFLGSLQNTVTTGSTTGPRRPPAPGREPRTGDRWTDVAWVHARRLGCGQRYPAH